MRIHLGETIDQLRYVNAGRRGKRVRAVLPVQLGSAELPDDLDALVLTSDLQGVVVSKAKTELLGSAVASRVAALVVPSGRVKAKRTGVVLGGDLFSAPGGDVRGATGDVRQVWSAFRKQGFAFVVGVQGNHDTYGDEEKEEAFREDHDVLDGEVVARAGLRIGGVSGVIGDPRKNARRGEDDFCDTVTLVAEERPDVLVMHQPPHLGEERRGHPAITKALSGYPGLVVCGHQHWSEPVAEERAAQIINVDARVVIVTRESFRSRA